MQNRKARKAEAEAKKTESAKNKKASTKETTKSTTEQKSTKDTSTTEKSKSQTSEKKVDKNAERSTEKNTDKKSDSKTAKKSKSKTADTVYKKNTKLKVGDTVGEVTLVADSETGVPVTPRLSASFAREDVPSYIMATIESLGDKELIAALEEEMFLMTADSDAELGLHDTIEELSDHVRDGEITPEQAAQVLSDELANPTGADIDTLVERAKLDGVKYMVAGDHSLTADISALKDAQRRWGKDSREDIIRDTGWWFDERAFKWKYEISDKDVDFEPLGFVAYPEYLPDYIKHDKLFDAYPQLASIRLEFDTLENEGGHYSPDDRSIILDNTGEYQYLKGALIHEIQHIIQLIEGFEAGTSLITTRMYLFNEYYERVKDSADFRSLKSPDEKYEFILRSFTKDDAEYQERAVDLYYDNNGEKEAYDTIYRMEMNDDELRKSPRDAAKTNSLKLNYSDIRKRYIDNMKNLGYNKSEILKKASQENYQYDNQHSNVKKPDVSMFSNSRLQKEDKTIRNSTRTVRQDKGWGIEPGGRISGRQVSLGRADGRTNKTSTQEYADIKYFLGDDTDTVPAVDFKARAENIIRLADMLQDGVKNDAEYTALSEFDIALCLID